TDLIGADGLIFHVGSGKELPKKDVFDHVAVAIHDVLAAVPGHTPLLMENAAGGGQKIGALPDDFAAILKKVPSLRLRICFDTAHAFEAGIIERYEPANIKKLFDVWDATVGLERINALHINDSKTAYNSHHDRHENLGKGFIGIAGFKNLAKEKRLAHAAWLLEVPGFANEGPDKKNMDILRSCFAPARRA
ncbi:MAG: TIM barrel protein, partial [Candidatus Sungbacteria bacterium]|nr:TIM barrel protein [Candidatus Sungbacteria bacterium]